MAQAPSKRLVTEDRGLLRGPARFHVRQYGAIGDGTSDDYPEFAACVADAVAYIQATSRPAIVDFTGMGTVLFGSGVSRNASVVKNAAGTGASIDATLSSYASCGLPIPPALPAKLTFLGHGTVVKGSASCINFAFPDRTRDYQVWQNLVFDHVTWDDANVGTTTKGHCIWGNVPTFGVKMRYTSLQDVELHDCTVLNAATDTSTTVGAGAMSRSLLFWSGDQNGPQETTQTFTRRIRTTGGTMNGGDQIYALFCTVADRYRAGGATLGGVNHVYTDIKIGDGWQHLNAVPQTQQRYQTSVYLGGSTLLLDRFFISEGYSENVGDDVIEVGGALRGEIVEPKCKNPFYNLILFRNTGPVDSARQLVTVRKAKTEVTSALSATTGAFAAPFAWIADDWYLNVSLSGTVTGGTFTLTIPLSSGSVTTAAIAYNATAAQVAAAIDAVVPAVNTSGPNGGVTGYAGGAVNSTTETRFVLVKQSLAANGRVTATSSLTGSGAGVKVGIASQGTAFGRFIIEDSLTLLDGLTSSRQGRTDLLTKGPGLGVPILGISLRRPRMELTNYTYDGSAANYELFMLVHANSLYDNWPCALQVVDASIKANGCDLAASTGSGFMYMVGAEGYSTVVEVDGLETDFTGSKNGTWGHVIVGKNRGSSIRAFVKRLKPKGQPTAASYAGLRIGTEGAVAISQLTESDFSVFGNPANGLIAGTGGTYGTVNGAAVNAHSNSPATVTTSSGVGNGSGTQVSVDTSPVATLDISSAAPYYYKALAPGAAALAGPAAGANVADVAAFQQALAVGLWLFEADLYYQVSAGTSGSLRLGIGGAGAAGASLGTAKSEQWTGLTSAPVEVLLNVLSAAGAAAVTTANAANVAGSSPGSLAATLPWRVSGLLNVTTAGVLGLIAQLSTGADRTSQFIPGSWARWTRIS